MLAKNISYGLTLLFIIIICIEACPQGKDELPSEGWNMHVIDNTSFGSDGTKVCDVNGDGYVDIVCGWEQGNVARIYINPLEGKEWNYVEVQAPNVEDAFAVDIDGDGFQDLITFSEGEHKRITFHWAPEGEKYMDSNHWKSEDVPCTISVTQWMFGRPMNVDNKFGIDIIVAGKNEGAVVGWLEAPSHPRNVSAWKLHTIAPASWVMSVEIIDINLDGQKDILISDRNNTTNGVKWFQHPGFKSNELHQYWSEHLIGMKERDPMFLAVDPLNEDGWVEIWVPDLRKDLFHFVQQDPSGLQWNCEKMPFPEGSGLIGKSASIGDIDNNGIKDLVTTYDGAEERLGVMWSSFNELNMQWTHHNVSGNPGNKFDFAYLLDMDGDGDLDILTSEENNNSSTVAGLGVIWYENPFN